MTHSHTHIAYIDTYTDIYIYIYHIIYKSSNRNKVRDKFGITHFEKLITMQIRSRD